MEYGSIEHMVLQHRPDGSDSLPDLPWVSTRRTISTPLSTKSTVAPGCGLSIDPSVMVTREMVRANGGKARYREELLQQTDHIQSKHATMAQSQKSKGVRSNVPEVERPYSQMLIA